MAEAIPSATFETDVPVGVISDTHGLLRDEALALLAGCYPLIHLGDVGDPAILERLAELAPRRVTAPRQPFGSQSRARAAGDDGDGEPRYREVALRPTLRTQNGSPDWLRRCRGRYSRKTTDRCTPRRSETDRIVP